MRVLTRSCVYAKLGEWRTNNSEQMLQDVGEASSHSVSVRAGKYDYY